jgi:hypothetical protein
VHSLRSSYGELINFITEFKDFATDKKTYKLKEEYQQIVNKEEKKLPLAFFQQKKDIYQDLNYITSDFFQSPRNANTSTEIFFKKYINFIKKKRK